MQINNNLRFIFDCLFEDIKHGDEEHQNWLRAKLDEFLDNHMYAPEVWLDFESLTQKEGEVLAFNEKWIDLDFNPKGVRVGFLTDSKIFISAKWWDYQDTYINSEVDQPTQWRKIIK